MYPKFEYRFAKGFDFHCSAEQKHQFFILPKILFENKNAYRKMALESKVLFGLMLDRTLDWTENPDHAGKQFVDAEGFVYIHIMQDEIVEHLSCETNMVQCYLHELEQLELIEKIDCENEYYVRHIPDSLDFICL